jgi:hypothetical protein
MQGRGLRAVVVSVALLFGAREARAQSAAPRAKVVVHIEYEAPGNCPSAHEFEAAVTGRTEQVELATDADGATAVAVKIRVRATGSTYAGHLFMVGREGTMSRRDVEDTLCAEVVDALALVTALAVDPNASLSAAHASPPVATNAAPAPAPPAPTPPAVPAMPEAPRPLVPDAHPAPARPAEDEPRTPTVPLTWHLDAGLEGDVLGGIAADAMLGAGAFVELASTGRRVFAPSARFALLGASNGAFEARTAAFTLLDARVDGCPLRFGRTAFSLRPCAAVDVGDLLASGLAIASQFSKSEPWVALSLHARLRWDAAPSRAKLAPFVELDGGVQFPLTRPTFAYENPDVTVAHPAAAAPTASLGAGLRFW